MDGTCCTIYPVITPDSSITPVITPDSSITPVVTKDSSITAVFGDGYVSLTQGTIQVFSGNGRPVGIVPEGAAIYYDLLSTQIYEWTTNPNAWILFVGGGSGAQYLYQLLDVNVQETGGIWSANLVSPPTSRIVGITDTQLSILGTTGFATGDRLSVQNTDAGNTLVVTSTGTQGPEFLVNFAGGGVFREWESGGGIVQQIYRYTPTVLAGGRALVWDGISAWRDAAIVNQLQINGANVTTGNLNFVNGTNTTVVKNPDGSFQVNATGGGGGGFSTVVSRWTTANATNKNAYTSPGVINADGITISLTASGNPGTLPSATVSLSGVALASTYPVTGTFPNYTITIPQADIATNAAQTASSVTVGVVMGTQFNLTAGSLTNTQPTPFAITFGASFVPASVPYYATTGNVNYQYQTQAGTATLLQGLVNGILAPNPSGSLTITLGTGGLTGFADGNGINGAAQGTRVNFNSPLVQPTFFTPAFWAGPLTGAAPPVFTQSSNQTPGGAVGSTVTYPLPTLASQYVWLATTRAATNIVLVTQFGNASVVPDVTGPQQTIAGTAFNVFGYSNLSLVNAVQFLIS